MRYDQRVQAERDWLQTATAWARNHPDATAGDVVAAIANPHKLLVRPLAGAALAAAARDREAEGRRRLYEAAHPTVRIWQDVGGWHARWPEGTTHRSVSHPVGLSGLLDRLDALAGATEVAH